MSIEIALLGAFFIGSVVSGAIGFGALLLYFSIGSFLIDDLRVLLLGASVGVLTKTIVTIYLFRGHIRWDITKRLLPWSIPLIAIGAYCTQFIPIEAFKKMIGIFILVFTAWKIFTPKIMPLKSWQEKIAAAVWGFISGLIGAGGPLLVALLSTYRLKKEAFVGTIQMIVLFSIPMKAPFYAFIPETHDAWWFLSAMAIIGFAGAWIGRKIHDAISEKAFERGVLGLLFFAGINLLFLA